MDIKNAMMFPTLAQAASNAYVRCRCPFAFPFFHWLQRAGLPPQPYSVLAAMSPLLIVNRGAGRSERSTLTVSPAT